MIVGLPVETVAPRQSIRWDVGSRVKSAVGLETTTRVSSSVALCEDCGEANAPRLALDVVIEGSVTQDRNLGRRKAWARRPVPDEMAWICGLRCMDRRALPWACTHQNLQARRHQCSSAGFGGLPVNMTSVPGQSSQPHMCRNVSMPVAAPHFWAWGLPYTSQSFRPERPSPGLGRVSVHMPCQ
ncbi:predicted protein [Verticillium alfalfae VaMs.102]|uniref:Predicted protein n=1 Tax=Verticillium alfalfae (strain VaMs.102 / ATCC MYA-4576 / FGSC 10136) TaxID=526221 RepID=C9S820_VERA1|nr:predicted protein [Verticillium alfalfae VaMs.102]EEY13897.1 predicted protein [Verticillium alfalfae VaMs.102]